MNPDSHLGRAADGSGGSRRSGTLLILFALALALRAWLAASIPVVTHDAAAGYLHQARALLRGNWVEGLGTYFPPGYPLAVSLVSLLGVPLVAAGYVVPVVGGALLVFPVFRVARDLFDVETAWIAAALTAGYPVLALSSAEAASEGLYTFLVITAIGMGYSLLRAESLRPGAAAGLGALWGAAYLVRGEALLMLGLYVLLVAGRLLASRRGNAIGAPWDFRHAAGFAGALLAGFLALAGPYMAFLRAEAGQVQLSGKTMENLLAYDLTERGVPVDVEAVRLGLAPDGRHLDMEDRKQGSAVRFLWENRGRQARRYLRNATEAYISCLPRTIYPAFLLLLGVGIHAAVKTGAGALQIGYLGCFFVFPFLFYPIFLIENRYFVPTSPLGLIVAAGGLAAAARGLPGHVRKSLLWTSVLVLLAAHAAPVVAALRSGPFRLAVEHRMAGEWLRQQDPAHPRVMNRKSYVAFYADGTAVFTPDAEYGELLAYARSRGVGYLVVDDRYTLPVRPSLRFLLDGPEPPADLEKIYERNEPHGARIAIFRLRPEGSQPEESLPEESQEP